MDRVTVVLKCFFFFSFFLFNLLFAILGLALMGVGIFFKLSLDDYVNASNSQEVVFSAAPTLVIVTGAIVFIIAFFGCYGAVRENVYMLTTYSITLLVILAIQVSFGVYTFLHFKDVQSTFKDVIVNDIYKTMDIYNSDNFARESVDSLQHILHCCGAKDSTEWEKIWNNDTLPSSCCPGPAHNNCVIGTAYETGCGDEIWEIIKQNVRIMMRVAVLLAAIELIGAVVALWLASSVRKIHRKVVYQKF